ncbi:unnamed protein product [Caenorhabditis angaria]|uniref:Uncharacterized protein n=1 Tax=Caenorhabditis angaria TaxID=860376 RepID=A0A9P1I8G2_9PELO|nr:unnamed protein product [Caenorhabditis angaria]
MNRSLKLRDEVSSGDSDEEDNEAEESEKTNKKKKTNLKTKKNKRQREYDYMSDSGSDSEQMKIEKERVEQVMEEQRNEDDFALKNDDLGLKNTKKAKIVKIILSKSTIF